MGSVPRSRRVMRARRCVPGAVAIEEATGRRSGSRARDTRRTLVRRARDAAILVEAGSCFESNQGANVNTIARIALVAGLAATTLAVARRAPVRHTATVYAFTN